MNDIVAPIFAVFLADHFGLSFAELEKEFPNMEKQFEGMDFLEVGLEGRS